MTTPNATLSAKLKTDCEIKSEDKITLFLDGLYKNGPGLRPFCCRRKSGIVTQTTRSKDVVCALEVESHQAQAAPTQKQTNKRRGDGRLAPLRSPWAVIDFGHK